MAFSTPLFALLSFCILYFARYAIQRRRQDVHRLPGPSSATASWLWGHELDVFQHQANESFRRWIPAFGQLYKIKGAFFHPDIVIAADHAVVQHIFQDSDHYVKSPAFRPPVANLLGKGLVWAEGDDHKNQRRILLPAFTPEAVKGMSDDIFECAEKLESRLTNHVLSNNGGTTINVVPYISACTLDIIGRVGFGFDFKSGESTEAKEIAASWHDHVNMGLTSAGFIAPLVLRALPFITRLPLKAIQQQGVIKQLVGKLSTRLIERGTHHDKGRDILSILLTANAKESHAEKLTQSQVVDNITTLTMVGHETTAGSLSFTLLELARNPEKQQKLREEVVQLRDLTYDGIQKLPYLDAVVKEGLRLHPASPQTERVALVDDVIPLSNPIRTSDGSVLTSLRVAAGQVFVIPFMAMQTNPKVWGKDAGEFVPERWITPGAMPSPSELPHGWSSLVTFCDGPRNCIGYRLALFEFKAILAAIVRSIELHDTTAIIKQKISPTLQPVTDGKGGLLPLHITLAQA